MNVNAELKRFCGLVSVVFILSVLSGCAGMTPGGTSDFGDDLAGDVALAESEATEMQEDTVASTDLETEEMEPFASISEEGIEDIQAEAEETAEEMVEASAPQEDSEEEAMPEEAAEVTTPKLIGLQLESLGEGRNAVVAQMHSAGFYTFVKTAPSEYVLTLEKATLETSADKTLVAPREAGQIRSVRPVVQDGNVALRIFANPETLLKAESDGNRIIVSAYNEEAIADDMRAQADVEEIEEEDEDLAEEIEDLFAEEQQYTGRLISLDLVDTDIDNALRIIAEVSNLNIIASDDVTGKVSLRLIDVPWDQALDVILKTNGLDKVQEGNVVRIAPVEKLRAEREALKHAKQAEEELEPLRVRYIRVSYAKASALQPLVETVITERGTVAYDERTNQLIVKDISKGIKNVVRLVSKLDLRTPQVLIETQIVEAERTFSRELGSEMGFFFMRSPDTGNPTPYNFPSTVSIGGDALDPEGLPTGNFSSYPSGDQQTAIDVLLGSADGTKGLNFRLSQGESEGRARVVSRPSVAVTNNTPAVIKSVRKLRIKLPSGGVSVATGQGANAAGGGSVATETIEIGIILNVTAQASPDYYVLMDIDAKSSTLGAANEVGVDDIPPEIERSATSTVLVSSGQTFALGGIYQIREREDLKGVPWVKDVPVLGQFFRSSSLSDTDQELIFFITPRIVEGSFDDAAMKSAL